MKILVVKLSSLGDVVQTIPAVRDMERAVPGARIDWVVEEGFAPLVERVAGLGRVLPIAQRRWRKDRWSAVTRQERGAFLDTLKSEAYDAVLDFQGLIKSALVARQARLAPGGFRATYGNASEACGYEWPVRWMLDRPLPMPRRIHAVARYRTLAAGALGYAFEGAARYALSVQPMPAQRSVVLAHGTTRPDNEWAEVHWLALARRLVEAGYSIALPHSGGAELEKVNRWAQAIGPQAQVWPRLPLAGVLDRMAACAGVIGVDSGLSHMAVALDLPHVQIFSQPRAWRAGPVGQPHQLAVGGEGAPDLETVWAGWRQVTMPR